MRCALVSPRRRMAIDSGFARVRTIRAIGRVRLRLGKPFVYARQKEEPILDIHFPHQACIFWFGHQWRTPVSLTRV